MIIRRVTCSTPPPVSVWSCLDFIGILDLDYRDHAQCNDIRMMSRRQAAAWEFGWYPNVWNNNRWGGRFNAFGSPQNVAIELLPQAVIVICECGQINRSLATIGRQRRFYLTIHVRCGAGCLSFAENLSSAGPWVRPKLSFMHHATAEWGVANFQCQCQESGNQLIVLLSITIQVIGLLIEEWLISDLPFVSFNCIPAGPSGKCFTISPMIDTNDYI